MRKLLSAMTTMMVLVTLVSCKSTSSETSEVVKTPDVIEEKVIERITFSNRDRDIVNVLTTDGCFYSSYVSRSGKIQVAERGDTVIIKNNELFQIKFVMSE